MTNNRKLTVEEKEEMRAGGVSDKAIQELEERGNPVEIEEILNTARTQISRAKLAKDMAKSKAEKYGLNHKTRTVEQEDFAHKFQ